MLRLTRALSWDERSATRHHGGEQPVGVGRVDRARVEPDLAVLRPRHHRYRRVPQGREQPPARPGKDHAHSGNLDVGQGTAAGRTGGDGHVGGYPGGTQPASPRLRLALDLLERAREHAQHRDVRERVAAQMLDERGAESGQRQLVGAHRP